MKYLKLIVIALIIVLALFFIKPTGNVIKNSIKIYFYEFSDCKISGQVFADGEYIGYA